MSGVRLGYTRNLKTGDWVMGTNRPGWQVVEEILLLPSGRFDIRMESGTVLRNSNPLTVWRLS